MKKVCLAIFVVLLASSCTVNFSRSYWRESQKNFHHVNADNQVYYAWIRHTTYPVTSSEDYCKTINNIPNRGELSYYGSITEECRGMILEKPNVQMPKGR
jgi:hypothetical protein